MHKCLGCGKIYDDDAEELAKGCPCGSKYFLYYKEDTIDIKNEDLKAIEKDILDIINKTPHFSEDTKNEVVIFDFESIIVPKQGKYLINLEKLFKEKAIVFRIKDGKYIIDFSKLLSFKNIHQQKKKTS